MFRLSEAAVAFAKIDKISDEKVPALDKALRNLTQRNYLAPSKRDGRADLYSVEAVCALRLAERATAFGIDRIALDDLLRFLQAAALHPTRYREADGVKIALTLIDEAVERARAGEDFHVGLTMDSNGRVAPRAWFAPEHLTDDAKTILADAKLATPLSEPDAAFRLDAGRLIRDVLKALAD